MKSFILKTTEIIFLIFFLLVLAVIGGAFWWYQSQISPYSSDTTTKDLEIERGETVASAAQKLEENNIIKNAFTFRLWAKFSGDEITVQAGKHKFSPSMTYKQIADELSLGIEDIKVLIKEGLRVEEIDEILKRELGNEYNSTEFLQKAKPLEGMLFPDTYVFQKNITAQTVISTLNKEFEDNYTSIKGPTDPKAKKEAVILASLLEREGRTDQDRPIIAGILQNRLKYKTAETVGLLQVDATLQYALGYNTQRNTWWASPKAEDKEVNSPYNTYKNTGFPPTPICNPGLSALKAAISPQANDYLYYIHDTSGKAYYAKTLDEHNRNIARYLQ